MRDDKYKVFKIDDYLEAYEALKDEPAMKQLNREDVDDAVVIRLQDLFAEPALHSYASAIGVAIAAMRETVTILDGYPDVRAEINAHVEQLQKVADHFHEASLEAADHTHKKMPD